MLTRPGQNQREADLRKYFEPMPSKPSRDLAVLLMIGGALLIAVGLNFYFSQRASGGAGAPAVLLVIAGLAIGLVGYFQWSSIESRHQKALEEILPQPTDEQVDQWFQESRQDLIKHSSSTLRLTDSEGNVANPLVLSAPTLNKVHGIPPDDLKWKKGQDGRLRFAIYHIVIVYLTERHLAAFTCDLNFLRDVSLNETIREYHYQDILSVVTYELSESFHLPTEKKRTTADIFRLSVASDYIEVRVDCNVLRQMTKEEEVPAMGAEETVRAIRAKLREKKA